MINYSTIHVDGSTIYYQDSEGFNHQSFGVGGIINHQNKIHKFSKSLTSNPFPDSHEHYAVIEGLVHAKKLAVKHVRLFTDSVESLKLFTNLKKQLTPKDKYFLVMFYYLENFFDDIVIEYYNRKPNDIAHTLSRGYLELIPKNASKIPNPSKELKVELEQRYSNTLLIASYIKEFFVKNC